jgi:hypothetical protein
MKPLVGHIEGATKTFENMLYARVHELIRTGTDDMKRRSLAKVACLYSTLTEATDADLKELVRDIWFKITRSMDSPKNSPFYHS